MATSRQVSPTSLLGVSAGNYQRVLMDELEIIRTYMGTQSRSEMVAMHGTPCAIPPCDSTNTPKFPFVCN
jgi:hypothetical protein